MESDRNVIKDFKTHHTLQAVTYIWNSFLKERHASKNKLQDPSKFSLHAAVRDHRTAKASVTSLTSEKEKETKVNENTFKEVDVRTNSIGGLWKRKRKFDSNGSDFQSTMNLIDVEKKRKQLKGFVNRITYEQKKIIFEERQKEKPLTYKQIAKS